MLFNSLEFVVFFLGVYCLYLVLTHRWQNRMLLVASYFFYGAWDWRFLSLIWLSTVIDYFCGAKIHEAQDARKRKLFLYLSLITNLLLLGFFKYFNFFAASFQELSAIFGFSAHPNFLRIVLPVGISFYTFQTMSYTIDIYRHKLRPALNFFDFALFVAYFPQLVAGPIERAKQLLPQIENPRTITLEKISEGMYLILWGYVLKVFVADNVAGIVDDIFLNKAFCNGAFLPLGLYAFAIQIFGDFAGYSNIARGLAKCMGIDLMVNFNLPYCAKNPQDFWRRWHISLSTWLKDYLYVSLGGNKRGKFLTYRNLFITMVLGGLWHGAAWTFVLWGAYHGVGLAIHRYLQPFLTRVPEFKNAVVRHTWSGFRMLCCFHFVCFGWLIFRAESLSHLKKLVAVLAGNFHLGSGFGLKDTLLRIILYSLPVIVMQFFQYRGNELMVVRKLNPVAKAILYNVFLALIIFFGNYGGNEFIYFQF